MKLTEKIAYTKGLIDGMELDRTTKENKAILAMMDVMEDMAVYIDDLQSQVDELTELCDLLDHDLGEVETDLYCDDDDDEDDDFDDEDEDFRLGEVLPADYDDFAFDDDEDFDEIQYVATCPSCDETVSLSERQLEEGSMICPHCGEPLEFNYDDIETDFSASEDDSDDTDADSSEEEVKF